MVACDFGSKDFTAITIYRLLSNGDFEIIGTKEYINGKNH